VKEVAKATAVLSNVTFANMVAGFVRSKFTALMLGVAGVGLFSQAFNLLQLAVTISSLSMRIGIIRYIAKFTGAHDHRKIRHVIAIALLCQLAVAAALFLVMAFNASLASRWIFGSADHGAYVFLVALNIPLVILSGIFEATIIGYGDYKNFTKGRVLATFLSVIPLLVFVGAFRMPGAFLYLLASSAIAFVIFLFLARRALPPESIPGLLDLREIFRERSELFDTAWGILSYSSASFVAGGIGLFTMLMTRSIMINRFGLESNGLYQVVFAISAYYLAFYTNSIWSYFYPKASASSEQDAEYADEINKTIRFCVFGALPFIVGIYLFRYQAIHLLYSRSFLGSGELFAMQLGGDLFYILFYIFGTSLLAKGDLRAYLVSNLGYSASFIGIFILAAPHAGLKSVVLSYMASNIVWASLLWAYHNRYLMVPISGRNRTLVIVASVLMAFVLFVDMPPLFSVCKGAVALVALYLLLTPHERTRIAQVIGEKTARIFKHGE
jgi:PST family polysaccharide transporter